MLKSLFMKSSLALVAVLIASGTVLAGGGGGGGLNVPESNPGMLGSASDLLVGGALMIRDRLRKS